MAVNGHLDFGHGMREHFLFDSKWRNLNHGSFGTFPVPVRNAKRGYMKLTEACPDKFLRYQYTDLEEKARTKIAELVNAPVNECVFVQNATSGINTVLRNLVYKEKDVIVYFDTIYGAIEKTLLSICETNPQLQIRKVGHGQDYAYKLPMSHAEICSAFSQTISRLLYEGYSVKAAVFDTIVAMPGVRFPFERLVRMCKEYNILSVIDGAHAIGMIPLNLSELDADFFTSNCHKWLYTPRGCALLHVPKRNQNLIRTTYPTSWGYVPPNSSSIRQVLPPSKQSDFVKMFSYVATLDNTAYYCVPAAVNFRQNLCGGEERIYRYVRDNAQRGADLLALILGTEVMDDLDPGSGLKTMGSYEGGTGQAQQMRNWAGGLRDCALANVLLPISILGAERNGSIRIGPGGSSSGGGLGIEYRKRPSITSLSSNGYMASPVLSSAPIGESVILKRDEVGPAIEWMQHTLVHEYNTFVAIYEYHSQIWCRLSGQIYLELKDWEWLGNILKTLLERVDNGEFNRKAEERNPALSRVVSELELERLGAGSPLLQAQYSTSPYAGPGKVFDISLGGWRHTS